MRSPVEPGLASAAGEQCTVLGYSLSPCAGCGQPIGSNAHAPDDSGGLYCARCCRTCQDRVEDPRPRASFKTEI